MHDYGATRGMEAGIPLCANGMPTGKSDVLHAKVEAGHLLLRDRDGTIVDNDRLDGSVVLEGRAAQGQAQKV